MVYKIQIKLKDKTGAVKVAYEASNLGNFDWNVLTPISTFGLPEDYLETAIITKAEGNTGKLVFGWVIRDEPTSPIITMTSWKDLWPDGAITSVPHQSTSTTTTYYSRRIKEGNTHQNYSLLTADAQMVALSELFEKRGFTGEERHEFILRNETDGYNIFHEEGLIQRMSFQKSGADPVTWNATVEFQIGDVVDSTA